MPKKKFVYMKNIVTFDTETTNMCEYHNKGKKKPKLEVKKSAFMYAWCICNCGCIIEGRTWKEFKNYLDAMCNVVKPNVRYIVWVHNLSFEFQFMKDFLPLTEVFSRKAHNVLRCVYRNIEFRDTLALANCKLEKLAKNEKLPIQKLVGDLDYDLIRHYDTPLTEKEWGYIHNDVLVVYEYIKKKVKEYGCLENIPMTSTGEVRYLFRKELGDKLKKMNGYVQLYSAHNMELQNLLIETYAGAYTHANYQIIGEELYDLFCEDIASSYPYQMVSKKYPTIWYKVDASQLALSEIIEKYPPEDFALIGKCKFVNIKAKHVHSIISQHKCARLSDDAVIDNGRVHSASYLEIGCTDVDLLNVLDFYNWEAMAMETIYVSKKEYLPKEIVSIILKLFRQKTELKDVEGEEENYMRSKARINGVYGMSVFNILASGIFFDEVSNCQFIKEEKTWADFKKYTANPNQFLWYSIGVWVTAYAKRHVLTPIKKMSENACYSDTDSVKGLCKSKYVKLFEHLNAKYKTEFYDAMRYHKFSEKEYQFYDKYGKQHFMGIFEEEKPYKRFKALGSKRYLVEYYDGSMSSTVAGAPKNLWSALGETNDERFENFKDGFSMKNCKLTHTYCEGKELRFITDYLGNTAVQDIRSGVCLTPADFSMSLADEFKDFLMGRIDMVGKDIYQYFIGQQKFNR